jgi:hypothetical protein
VRRILLGGIAALAFYATPADARGYVRHHVSARHYYTSIAYWRHRHRVARSHLTHHAAHSFRAGGRPSCFYTAASMGGPCGCWAASHLLGIVDHVWHGINLWLANDWLKFPHVAAAPGTAAVWPNRHVAPVVAVHGDGTVTVNDSWNARHRVRMAGLVFVQPPVRLGL